MSDRQPFLYAIGWSELNVWYIGIRYAKGCSPLDMWTTYFTSSKLVKQMREEFGEPDHFEILATGTPEEVIELEELLLRQFDLPNDPRWLNLNAGGGYFAKLGFTAEHRAKMSEAARNRIVSETTKAKMSASAKRRDPRPQSEQTRQKLSRLRSGGTISEAHKQAISIARSGKPRSPETKAKISAARKASALKKSQMKLAGTDYVSPKTNDCLSSPSIAALVDGLRDNEQQNTDLP